MVIGIITTLSKINDHGYWDYDYFFLKVEIIWLLTSWLLSKSRYHMVIDIMTILSKSRDHLVIAIMTTL